MKDKENILKDKKIMLVEDDQLFATMVMKKIQLKKGISAYASNGEEALEKIPIEKPDLLLLDLLMPGKINGFGVLESIKTDPNLKDIPVIIVSNLSENKDIDRGMRLGAFRYLVKSTISPSQIIENIESALR